MPIIDLVPIDNIFHLSNEHIHFFHINFLLRKCFVLHFDIT